MVVPLTPANQHGYATPENVKLGPLLLCQMTALLSERAPAIPMPVLPVTTPPIAAVLFVACHVQAVIYMYICRIYICVVYYIVVCFSGELKKNCRENKLSQAK
nr:hypothetical protein Iba_chr05dCG19830 [Ipomoea batatas]GMD39492.1 hypothetical protein Iba_chr10aCG0270 [Ipomoea batatas]GMD46174.1 hypothetical protein Iba_chr10eCG0770 [Ipomoea batatas]